MMRQIQDHLSLSPGRQGLHEITDAVVTWLSVQSVRTGLLTLFLRHTSASLLIQENADPDVRRDLEGFFRKIVPEDASLYRHVAEGPDDMPAHVRCALTQTQLSIPVSDGRLLLGTWQGIYLFEHRHAPGQRELVLHFVGD